VFLSLTGHMTENEAEETSQEEQVRELGEVA